MRTFTLIGCDASIQTSLMNHINSSLLPHRTALNSANLIRNRLRYNSMYHIMFSTHRDLSHLIEMTSMLVNIYETSKSHLREISELRFHTSDSPRNLDTSFISLPVKKSIRVDLTNSLKHSPYSAASSHSVMKLPAYLRNPEFPYTFHNSQPSDHSLSQMNPLHTFPHYSATQC
jgi:hypothetical protein